MSRLLMKLAPAAAVTVALLAPASASAATCRLSSSEQRGGLGATYTTSLEVKGIACPGGKRVARAFNACRKAAGGANGRCGRKVRRFRCSERRFNRIKTQYDSKVTCKRSAKRVIFTYTQFT